MAEPEFSRKDRQGRKEGEASLAAVAGSMQDFPDGHRASLTRRSRNQTGYIFMQYRMSNSE